MRDPTGMREAGLIVEQHHLLTAAVDSALVSKPLEVEVGAWHGREASGYVSPPNFAETSNDLPDTQRFALGGSMVGAIGAYAWEGPGAF